MIGSIIIILNWRLLRWMIFIFGTSFALSIRRTSRERRKWFFVGSASELQEKAWLQWILLGCIYVDVDFRPICTKIAQRGTLVPYSKGVATVVAGSAETILRATKCYNEAPISTFQWSVGWFPWVRRGIKVPVVASVSEITRQILRGSDGKMSMGLQCISKR